MDSIGDLRLNQTQAAELLGVSRRFLTIDDDAAPREPDGSYLATKIVAWFVAHGSEVDQQIKAEKLRKLKRENDIAERSLVSIEELRPHTNLLQDSLREFGDAMARKKTITGKQVQAMFNKVLRAVEAKILSVAGSDS